MVVLERLSSPILSRKTFGINGNRTDAESKEQKKNPNATGHETPKRNRTGNETEPEPKSYITGTKP